MKNPNRKAQAFPVPRCKRKKSCLVDISSVVSSNLYEGFFMVPIERRITCPLKMHNKCWWRGHCTGKGIWSPITTVKRGHVILKASLQASIKKRKHQIFSLKVDGLCHDEASWHQISQLRAKSEQKQEKIIALKDHTNHLLKDILRECIASNVIIDKAIIEACVFTTKTLEIIREATMSMLRPKNKSLLSALMKMLGYMQ